VKGFRRLNKIMGEKSVSAEFPFSEYWLYVVHHKKENRNYAVLMNKNNSKDRTTLAYARYLMCVKEERILEKDETVDHIDDDKTNDNIYNLQILSRKDNHKKYTDKLLAKYVVLECPNCKKIFEKRANDANVLNGGVFTSCCRRCCGIIRQKLQMGEVFDFSSNVVKTYYK
jgi:hypothetical protein